MMSLNSNFDANNYFEFGKHRREVWLPGVAGGDCGVGAPMAAAKTKH